MMALWRKCNARKQQRLSMDAMTEEQVEREFTRFLKPNAVVLEKSSAGFHDINARHVSAMEDIVHHNSGTAETALPEVVSYTGTKLLDQFQPTYFGLAFPFVFPYGVGMPDPPRWSKQPRHRRAAIEPRVELSTWVRALARAVWRRKLVEIGSLASHRGISFSGLH